METQKNKDVAIGWFEASMTGDAERAVALIDLERFRCWMIGTLPISGWGDASKFAVAGGMMGDTLAGPVTFRIGAVTAEDDRVWIEAESHAPLKAGGAYENTYLMAVRVDDGKLVELKEFSDTLHMYEVFGGPQTHGPRKPRESPLHEVSKEFRGQVPPVPSPRPRPAGTQAGSAESLQANKDVALAWFEAGTEGDAERGMELFDAPGFRHFVTGTLPLSGWGDASTFAATAGMLGEVFDGSIAFRVGEVTAEDDRVLIEAETYAPLKDGGTYENSYVMALRVVDGKVVELKEFSDTLHIYEAFDRPETRGPRKPRESPLREVTKEIRGLAPVVGDEPSGQH